MADKRLHNNNKILSTPKTKITLRRNDDVESGKQAVLRRAGGIDDRMLVRCASIAFEVRWTLSFRCGGRLFWGVGGDAILIPVVTSVQIITNERATKRHIL